MKTILIAMIVLAAAGCANLRETQQVDMVKVHVIKVDTVLRHPDPLKQLTWKDQDNIEYISYVSIHNLTYVVGSTMYVMRKR